MFVSDGKRTWDPDRGYELKRLSGTRDVDHFELSSPGGGIEFDAGWSTRSSSNKPHPYPNGTVIWTVYLNAQSLSEMRLEETKQVIAEAFESYETIYGINSIGGSKPPAVICEFYNEIIKDWEPFHAA